ncbi:MAG TPA: thymidine phosphorylase, partial [Ruminococcaceae bacterium]|nr:thymidine phosphorylase [Oscillospiraceae bacterium]
GRALGNEGGTIDKLESIKDFDVNMSMDEFARNVNKNKFAVGAQTAELAPADKKIYALRDVTGTIESIPLIASSIMSKKLATGADCLVLDVTTGDGSFMKTVDDAEKLANEMADIGAAAGMKTVACITDMSQPLGYAIGNALEVREAVETLKGNGPDDVLEIALTLGSYMVYLSGAVGSIDEARKKLKHTIDDGSAYKKFLAFVAEQGGDVSCIEDLSKMPTAAHVYPVTAQKDGYITKMTASELGRASMELGAGRQTKSEPIDYAVGVVLNKKLGDSVKKGEALAYLHYNDDKKLKEEIERVSQSYTVSDTPAEKRPLVYKVIANKQCNL